MVMCMLLQAVGRCLALLQKKRPALALLWVLCTYILAATSIIRCGRSLSGPVNWKSRGNFRLILDDVYRQCFPG